MAVCTWHAIPLVWSNMRLMLGSSAWLFDKSPGSLCIYCRTPIAGSPALLGAALCSGSTLTTALALAQRVVDCWKGVRDGGACCIGKARQIFNEA